MVPLEDSKLVDELEQHLLVLHLLLGVLIFGTTQLSWVDIGAETESLGRFPARSGLKAQNLHLLDAVLDISKLAQAQSNWLGDIVLELSAQVLFVERQFHRGALVLDSLASKVCDGQASDLGALMHHASALVEHCSRLEKLFESLCEGVDELEEVRQAFVRKPVGAGVDEVVAEANLLQLLLKPLQCALLEELKTGLSEHRPWWVERGAEKCCTQSRAAAAARNRAVLELEYGKTNEDRQLSGKEPEWRG
mmetsp:Transcript_1989/g.6098  ORF Transcript_1989/g.6098 Transcript_1989/m.6098 type:complete len:250 (-) Transcript_1989:126-875(-)